MAIEWLIVIGLVWGITNALIKQGTLVAERNKKHMSSSTKWNHQSRGVISLLLSHLNEWINLLCIWQYSLPFFINLSASALFFVKLSDMPITMAVPVTNAITFGATAAAGAALGEKMYFFRTVLGLALIIVGVSICVMPMDSLAKLLEKEHFILF